MRIRNNTKQNKIVIKKLYINYVFLCKIKKKQTVKKIVYELINLFNKIFKKQIK